MSYFCHSGVGFFRPLEDWWGIITCDPEIVRYFCWLARTYGVSKEAGSRNGPHISAVKGERIKNIKLWKKLKGRPIKFQYSNQIRDNGYHAWLDAYSPELSNLRKGLGLKEKPYHSFHLTIGRLRYGMDHASHEPRPKNIKKKKREPDMRSKY